MQYYRSSNLNFNKNGDVKLKPISGTIRIELNTGLNEIDFEIPYDKTGKWKKINSWGVIKQKVFYSNNKQLYRIYSVIKGMFSIRIKARHIFFDLIKRNLLDVRAVNVNGERALNIILEGTDFKGHSDINIVNTAYFVKTNILAAINGEQDNTFRNRWGGEMLYDNFDIYINKRIGGDYGVKVRYGVNMENVDLEIERDEIITRAYPIAYDGIMLPEKFIDSPIIEKYPIVCEGYIDMSDLKLRDSSSEDSEGFETEEELFNAMRKRIKDLYEGGLDKPKVSGSVKMVNLENTIEYKDFKNLVNVGIGDTVTVKHKNIDVDMKTRAVAIEWDIISEKYTNIEFGEVELNYFDKQDISNERLENILNKNGGVDASVVEGFLNSTKTTIKAIKGVAVKQDVIAMQFEDLNKDSPTYGSCIGGSLGIMVSQQRTLDGKDWEYTSALTPKGLVANMLYGKILAGANTFFDLETGEIRFTKGLITGSNTIINLDTGEIKFTKGIIKGNNTTIDLNNGKIESILSDGSKLIIDPREGFYNMNGKTKREYHHLSYSGEVEFTPGNMKTVRLPDEFKRKKFYVSVFPLNMNVPNGAAINLECFLNNWGINFTNTSSHCDYENGTFDCYMFSNFWDSINKTLIQGYPKLGYIVTA